MIRTLALTAFVFVAAPAVAALVFVSRTLAGIATRRGPVSAIGEAASPIACAAHECGAEAPQNTWVNGEISA